MSPVVVLVGAPGAGKTSVAMALSRLLGVRMRDTDDDIVAATGRTISDIFTNDGEPRFRELESAAVVTALNDHDGVLALGGGAILAEANRAALRRHPVVHLQVGMAQGVRRTGLASNRPMFTGVNPRATFKALLDARLPLYREVATIEVDTDTRTVDEVTADIAAWLRES